MNTQQNNTSENQNNITGVKLAHELMVDIMDGLIPGVLFLFSIMVCVVFPVFCYIGIPEFPNEDSQGGWFWVVVFLTFLILSYVIGHIFYRSDIKEPDKADINRQRKKLKEQLIEKVNQELQQKDGVYSAIKYLGNLLISEIEPLYNNLK